MNVCWLRLDGLDNKDNKCNKHNKHNKQLVTKFLDQIKKSSEYVSMCNLPINRLGKYSNNDNTLARLNKFYQDYQYNHKIYVKYHNKINDDDDEEILNKSKKINKIKKADILVELDGDDVNDSSDNSDDNDNGGRKVVNDPSDKLYVKGGKIDLDKIKYFFTK